ncbi:Phosphotransferase enzyme family protein [Amycolatopsis pretoriensis]|uniref:Phosphotransferase enzyme family protein n=1 Tax=Amycolatopsis pretoriensis TaxID=218821 RepID=A0A1H5QFW5_9PSEU|nr:phosphotransferase [Amycolatopsis pretoriensis]SEF24258.1 Phosphotransferase enzyme family protein [Amycolatopsis pretoriensis]
MDLRFERPEHKAELDNVLGPGIIEELLIKSFPGRTALHIRQLTPGLSGAAVLQVRPEKDDAQHPCVAKVGHSRDIRGEYERWQQFVQPYLSHGQMPDVMSPPVEAENGYAALVYKFYAANTLTEKLRGQANGKNSGAIAATLEQLFRILQIWHRSKRATYLDLITEEYPLSLEALDQFELTCRRFDLDPGGHVRAIWTEPAETLRQARAHLEATSHGDLHANNVLVGPGDELGIIDFLYTGKHHFLRDYSTFEADLVLRVLCPEELPGDALSELWDSLVPFYASPFAERADDLPYTEGPHQVIRNAVRTLRAAVWRRAERDVDEIPGYYLGLVRRMLRMSSRADGDLTEGQRRLGCRIVLTLATTLSELTGDSQSEGESTEVAALAAGVAADRQERSILDLESEAEVASGRLSVLWQPPGPSSAEIGLTDIASELRQLLPRHRRSLSVTFDRLIDAYPDPVGEEELYRVALKDLSKPLIEEINQRLVKLHTNRLPEFRVIQVVTPDQRPAWRISALDITTLLSRTPHDISIMEPVLRAAWSLYDAGSYTESLDLFLRVAGEISDGSLHLTRSELAVFFYYFSKCLLKLNMYSALVSCVEGPYRAFSDALCPQLETERLQIAGVLYRQQGVLTAAQACLDSAVEKLRLAAESASSPLAWRSLADACVLSAHPRLDAAVQSGGHLAGEIMLRDAESMHKQAREAFERYWSETGQPTHYEGRLAGTDAYLTVARSVVDHAGLEQADWRHATAQARRGFEPESERKPVGIVSGKAAFAAVKLAWARWELARDRSATSAAQAHLTEAAEVLQTVFQQPHNKVELGRRFEYRKLIALRRSVERLQEDLGADVDPDALTPII